MRTPKRYGVPTIRYLGIRSRMAHDQLGMHHEPTMTSSLDAGFAIAVWRVEPLRNRIVCEGQDTHLEPKAMDVLVALASRAPDTISRDALIEAVWQDVAVADDVLTNAIWQLRRVFDDDAQDPKVIETIRGRGYRLVAPIEVLADRPVEASGAESLPSTGPAPPVSGHRTSMAVAGAFIVMIALTAFVAVQRWSEPSSSAPSAEPSSPVKPDGLTVRESSPLDAARSALMDRHDWTAAEVAIRNAVATAPNDAAVRERLAWLLTLQGRNEEALVAISRARVLAPDDPLVATGEARIAYFMGDYPRTLAAARRALALDRGCRPAHRWLAFGLAAAGDHAAAVDALRRLRPRAAWVGDVAHAWALTGDRDEAERLMESPAGRQASRYQHALAHMGQDRPELALTALELAVERNDPQINQIAADPRFAPLRGQPRFKAIAASVANRR